jgi:hypothetical protein
VEVRVPDPEGNLAVARRRALGLALSRAVETVVARHVPAAEVAERRRDLRSIFFSQPSPFVQRYGITSEGYSGEDLVLSLDADVSQQKILGELRARGFTARVLPARPRVLVAALGGPEAAEAAREVRRRLEAEGTPARVLPEGERFGVDEAQLAAWALELGCHVAFGVTVVPPPEESEPAEAPAPAEPAGDIWGPAPAPRVAERALAQGWVVDARTRAVLGRAEAAAEGEGIDAEAARGRAYSRVGEHLAYALLAELEQSGWVPGEVARTVDLEVEGLPGPDAVEAIQRALPLVADVRRAELREIGHRSATWRVDALSTGVGWDALLDAVRLPRGRLMLAGGDWVGAEGVPERVRALWVEP